MAWWSSFLNLGLDKYKEQKDAQKRTREAEARLSELRGLGPQAIDSRLLESAEGIEKQLKDARQGMGRPLSTPRSKYLKYGLGR